jgi:hypothetical protein
VGESLTRFLKWLAAEPKASRAVWWILLFIASFLSFFGVFFISFRLTPIGLSLQQVLICTVLIIAFMAVHELGHLLGASLVGIPTRGLYFLPFLGAAADIDKKSAGAVDRWKDLLLSIAGPFFGLIVLLPILILKISNILPVSIAAMMWIAISIYNMLPIYPFDGGRIALDITTSFVGEQISYKLSRFMGALIYILLTGLIIWGLSWWLKLSWPWTLATVVLIWLSYLSFGKGKIADEDRTGKPMRKMFALVCILLYLVISGGYLAIFVFLLRS